MTRFTTCRRAPERDTLTPTTPATIHLSPLLSGPKSPSAPGVCPAGVWGWLWLPGLCIPVSELVAAAQAPTHGAATTSSLPALSCLITPKIPGVHCFASPALEAFLNFAVLKAFYFQQGCKWRGEILQPPGDSAGGEPWGSSFRVRRGEVEESPISHFQLIQNLTGERNSSNNLVTHWGSSSTAVGEGKAPRQD